MKSSKFKWLKYWSIHRYYSSCVLLLCVSNQINLVFSGLWTSLHHWWARSSSAGSIYLLLLLFYFLVVTAEINEDLLCFCFFYLMLQNIGICSYLLSQHSAEFTVTIISEWQHNSGEECRWKLSLVITVAHSVSHTFSFSKGLWKSWVRYCSSISNSDLGLFWGGSSRTVLCPPVWWSLDLTRCVALKS